MRDGDLDIYTMKLDGTNVKRLTETIGYDGGASFRQIANAWSTGPITPQPTKKSKPTKICWRKPGRTFTHGTVHHERGRIESNADHE